MNCPPSTAVRCAPVLFIDDDEIVRSLALAMFDTLGVELVVAQNGAEAVKRIASETFSLVITDIMMPEMDGLEVISWMRKNEPDVPVVVLSGEENSFSRTYASVAVELGAESGIEKPITQSKIQQALSYRNV